MLTPKKLEKMKPNTIFASGIGLIEHPYFKDAKPISKGGTLEKDGKSTKVKWVAITGGVNDWAIYHSLDANFVQARYLDDPIHLQETNERIAKFGAKLHDEAKIKEWVPCDKEAFALYRH